MRQTQSAAPRPAICIKESTLAPASTNARSAARICVTVRIWSVCVIDFGCDWKKISISRHAYIQLSVGQRGSRRLCPVSHRQAGSVSHHAEATERAVGMMNNKCELAVLFRTFDGTDLGQFRRTTNSASNMFIAGCDRWRFVMR